MVKAHFTFNTSSLFSLKPGPNVSEHTIQGSISVENELPIHLRELSATIQRKVDSIPNNDVLKPHMPVTVFVSEFGKNLANMEEDKECWIKAGFNWSLFYEFKELHKKLFRSNSTVVVNRDNVSTALREWQKCKDSVKKERDRLIAACKIIVSLDSSYVSVLKEISEGKTNMDSVQDLLSLTKLLLMVIELVSVITIGGIRIDEDYLNRIMDWASELKIILNRADASRHRRHESIVYRNKIIMLCREAQQKIDTWLDAVYFDTPGKKDKYKSDYFRRMRIKYSKPKKPGTKERNRSAS
ncbi:hypothetical protein QA601_04115 [Chitinispirillales bacterium ANBcel5]|uniref:hypothetical protein n=1 Tax=Cellulosispirillum alkaliphilum TaxID=3039283 RepID=UPI002A506EF0|nr:hypothetical protein [Chitinispirillales bacterium ANBcel5]